MHGDLFRQALRLARLDPNKPRQANLRRAVSAAYYALFHFLVDRSCRSALGSVNARAAYRHVLGRAFEHATMKDACNSYAGGTLRHSVRKGLPDSFVIPAEVKDIAAAFLDLHRKRQLADYDLTERFNRDDVVTLVGETREVVERFRRLPSSVEVRFFLACLWAWNPLGKR